MLPGHIEALSGIELVKTRRKKRNRLTHHGNESQSSQFCVERTTEQSTLAFFSQMKGNVSDWIL